MIEEKAVANAKNEVDKRLRHNQKEERGETRKRKEMEREE